jgi:CO dehydrogenase maturation factor
MTLSLAIAGKGGIGKTTLSAMLVRAMRDAGMRPVLAVDADPNSNLAEALGVPAGRPLAEIREHCSRTEGSPASGVGRVRLVEDEIQRALVEAEGFDLIAMGRPEGPRCYCYANNLLRQSLDALGRNYRAVVVDNEAGMEHLSRRTTNDVDYLLVVLNPTMPSLRAAERILELSRQLPIRIGRRAVLANRVGSEGLPPAIDQALVHCHAERLPDVPQDDAVEHCGACGGDVFSIPADGPALSAVGRIVEALCSYDEVTRWHKP